MSGAEAYPLYWPEGWQRTPRGRRKEASYTVNFNRARKELHRELRLLGARHVVLSTNIPLRKDGEPYSNWREPEDPGVAVYWTLKGKPQVMACDKWSKVRYNLRAVGLAVGALRMLDRTGASEIMERAFMGFQALPSQGGEEHWRVTLGFDPEEPVTPDLLTKRFRELARTHHPDQGGVAEDFRKLNSAYEKARQELGL